MHTTIRRWGCYSHLDHSRNEINCWYSSNIVSGGKDEMWASSRLTQNCPFTLKQTCSLFRWSPDPNGHISLFLSFSLSLSLQLTAARAQSALSAPLWQRQRSGGRPVLTATVRVERIFLWWNTAASSQEQQVAQPRCKSKTHPCAKSYTERSARGVAAVWKCMSNTDSIDVWSAVACLPRRKESGEK